MGPRPEIEEEADYIRLQGGEMPEVARQESLHQLKEIGVVPTPEEERLLLAAVADRYRDMIARDLEPDHQTESFFRGPERAAVNLARLEKFSGIHGIDVHEVRREMAGRFRRYLEHEARLIEMGRNFNTLGLAPEQAADFASRLGLQDAAADELLQKVNSRPWLDFRKSVPASRLWRRKNPGD